LDKGPGLLYQYWRTGKTFGLMTNIMKKLILSCGLCAFAFVLSCPAADQAPAAPKTAATDKATATASAKAAVKATPKAKTEDCGCDGMPTASAKPVLLSPKALAALSR
jgi:hypothetical protein